MLKVFYSQVLVFYYTSVHTLFDIVLLKNFVFLIQKDESMLQVANIGIQYFIVFVQVVNKVFYEHQIVRVEGRQLSIAMNSIFLCLS